MERDLCFLFLSAFHFKFQLTRSRGAWRIWYWNQFILWRFQLTRSRGAWHINIFNIFSFLHISTHTLTWSVTLDTLEKSAKTEFQLTRSRGAWREDFDFTLNKLKDFNSHAHVERDANPRVTSIYNPISTHTLTWSVTIMAKWDTFLHEFQLTRSRGAWRMTAKKSR